MLFRSKPDTQRFDHGVGTGRFRLDRQEERRFPFQRDQIVFWDDAFPIEGESGAMTRGFGFAADADRFVLSHL